MATNDIQILIVVDVYPDVSDADLKAMLPAEREDRKVLKLTEFGAPVLAPPPAVPAVDWVTMATAVAKLSDEAHALQKAARTNPVVLYIGGKGPLAVFVHLGYLFTKSFTKVEVFNVPHGSGAWERFSMDAPPTSMHIPNLFDHRRGVPKEPSTSDGRLGIFVDPAGRPYDATPFKAFFQAEKESMGEVAALCRKDRLVVDALNMGAIVRELAQFMSDVPAYWPERRGTAVFVAGPTQLAFALGRAMSPNVLRGDVWLTEYRGGKYEKVISLPFDPPAEPAISQTSEAILARRDVLDRAMEAYDDLRENLEVSHVPEGLLRGDERARFVDMVKRMRLVKDCVGDQPFQLRWLEGSIQLGSGILEAMVGRDADEQRDFAKLVILHEIVHDVQNLRSTNHSNVGLAGHVLEEVDFLADVFSVHTLVNMELAGEKRAQKEVSKRVTRWVDRVIDGISAFDRMEHGKRIERLAERRLRRYLLWYVQHARAKTLREAADVGEMLGSALAVELAPLSGGTSSMRHEKMVKGALAETELFVSVNGRLVRVKAMTGHDIAGIVEAVRDYRHEDVQRVMFAVVDNHRKTLAPWTEGK